MNSRKYRGVCIDQTVMFTTYDKTSEAAGIFVTFICYLVPLGALLVIKTLEEERYVVINGL